LPADFSTCGFWAAEFGNPGIFSPEKNAGELRTALNVIELIHSMISPDIS
jgi:hypothetical protein